jgi:CheY-like chemotaxis protein
LLGVIFSISLLQFTVYAVSDDVKAQIEQHKQMVAKYETEGNKTELTRHVSKLGYLYWQIGANSDAVRYFERAIILNTELKNENALKTLYNNLGLIWSEQGDFNKAISYFEQSLRLNLKHKKMDAVASDYLNIALSFQSLGYYSESNNRANQALAKALELNNLEIAKTCYGILAENHEKLGQNKESSDYYEKYNALTKHLQKEQMSQMASQTKEFEKKVQSSEKELKSTLDNLGEVLEQNREMQLQNALLNKENQLNEEQKARLEAERMRLESIEKTRRTQIAALSVVLLMFMSIVILVFWQFQQKKKANKLLQQQNEEIENQKREIEAQRDLANKQKMRITDSIQYAQRIQKAVLPPEKVLNKSFKDYFIFYRPKDIVSGDFYWIAEKDEILIIAAADCTGHGVPGAFMSMLGVAYLNEIVNKIAINKHINTLSPDEILNQLREMVITSLRQTGDPTEPKDGMDIALLIIDFEHKKLQFAGANNPLYIIRNGELLTFKADKMPVSYHQKRDLPFSRHNFDLKPDDRLYIFSDGFTDQFGGDKGLKFMSKQFRELLLKIHALPMNEQHKLLENTLDEWRGDNHQLDDILVIGIRYGTTVTFPASSQKLNWQSKTILIAEDTDVNFFLLMAVLENTNAKLIRVKDGLEAVDFIKNNEVDLILMDINMPNMNGYDATKAIKSLRSDIPIIVQTAMHFEDESDEAFKAGADDYITKPIDLKTFMRKMERFLS